MSYQEDFIAKIAPYMQKYAVKYGHKVVSAAIGQACLESGYGTLFKATNHNNYFGLKYRQGRLTCNNGYFKDGSTEQLKDGTSYNITDLWYHFDSMEAGCEGYYQFINISNYANLKTSTTPLQYLTNIKNDGYATDINYVQKVSNIIAKYNLTQYDTLKVDPTVKPEQPFIGITKQCSTANTTVLQGRKINYVVLHYAASIDSKAGTARGIASYFAKTSTKASADFIVDETEIVQYNPDLTNRYTWAVGGNKYTSMSTSQGGIYYGKCSNKNSISIEMCSKKRSTATKNATDTDWYFEESVVNNAVELTKYLMNKYNIDIDHVIMHHHVTGKICPNPWCVKENNLQEWNKFKQRCGGRSSDPQPSQPIVTPVTAVDTNMIVKVLVNDLVIRRTPEGESTGLRTGKGTFTIVKKCGDYGLLKSNAGWIFLGNDKYIQIISENTQNTNPIAAAAKVKVLVDDLKIRLKPNGSWSGKYTGKGVFTIVEIQRDWGLLASYKNQRNGWIYLANSKYVIKV